MLGLLILVALATMPTIAPVLTEAMQDTLDLLLLAAQVAVLSMTLGPAEALQDMLNLLLSWRWPRGSRWRRGPPGPCRTSWTCRCS